MGKTITITKALVVADFTNIETATSAVKNILDPCGVVLTESEAKGLVGVSTVRGAEINEIKEKIVEKHAEALPDKYSVSDFEADAAYLVSLKKMHTGLVDQAAKAEVLVLVAENNFYIKASTILKHTNLLGKTDKVLGDIGKAISDKYHPHVPGVSDATNYKLGVSMSATHGGVVHKKVFTNKSKAVLSVLLVGGNVNDTILVNPFSGVILPETWVNIVVTNLSATEPGSYDVFIR